MTIRIRKTVFFLVAAILFLLTIPYFLYTHAQDASVSATGCFVLNPNDIPSNEPLPPGCSNSSTSTNLSKVPLYKQWDSRWGNDPFGSCGTIASSGCGPTSMAMVISYWTGKQVLPPQTAKLSDHVCGEGTAYSSLISVPESFGLKSKVVSWDEAKRYLQQGIPIINVQGPGYFTLDGHYIVLTEINSDGTFAINDPDGFHRIKATEAQITASRIESWVITK